ncbi:MAG: hypothetical protein ACOY7P_04250 [Pseudomonadota bacterium]
MTTDDVIEVFEERAEHLAKDRLLEWTATSEIDLATIAKLKGPGSKLLSGPRGSGKSTLLRCAYFELIDTEGVLPAYINYSQSLALEPLFHSHANALRVFRQWLLLKIVFALRESIELKGLETPDEFRALSESAQASIYALERGDEPYFDRMLSPTELVVIVESLLNTLHLGRCVLLMDDAAHAFSSEQQREFFEVFRQLKSRRIASKAAIYPGVTSYSHTFNVGHEAEVLEAWYRPDLPYFLPLMREIAEKRLPDSMKERFGNNFHEYIDLLALASFGQPRGFFIMLSGVLEPLGTSKSITRASVLRAISEYSVYVLEVHRSIAKRLRIYRNFIELGQHLESTMVAKIKAYNATAKQPTRSTIVGIREPIPATMEKCLQFLEYAGLARKLASHSRGPRRYERYGIHYAVLISENAFSLGQRYRLADVANAIRKSDQRFYFASKYDLLISAEKLDNCKLALPPCQKCGTERISESQKFCTACGSELTEASLYKQLLQSPIQQLPLTQKKIEGILRHTRIRTIQDLLSDDTQSIKTVPYISNVWAQRIRTMAEEFLIV